MLERHRAALKAPRPRQAQQTAPLNGMLHVMEQGCTWRALPARFGPWHTPYMRMCRWAKKGILARVFDELKRTGAIPSKVDLASLDTFVTVTFLPNPRGATGCWWRVG